jgi:polysaccharide export outer membrane protein
VAVLVAAAGCRTGASLPASPDDAARARERASAAEALDERIAAPLARPVNERSADYRVGPGDVLEIAVFQVDELSRVVRIRPDGSVSLPLLGALHIAGETTGAVERILSERLAAAYLKDPQVSVFVREYRAHPVSVLGEVTRPGVYYLRRPRTVVEMLSEAGGLTIDAGPTVHLRRQAASLSEATRLETITLDIRSLLAGERGDDADLSLRDDDVIYVPKAGVVFVEGSVKNPGAYPLHGATTVLKAVTLAGGLDFGARKSGIRVIRAGTSPSEIAYVDLQAIRDDPATDVAIYDGDVVVIGSNPVKAGVAAVWEGVARLVNVSKGF